MSIDAFLEIKLRYNTLTKAHKKLADFIIANPDFVLNKSITEVADTCNIGDATITRFCKILGYKGYYDLKLAIVRDLPKSESDHVLENVINQKDSLSKMTKMILSKSIEALTETNDIIKEEEIKKAVNFLINAKRIMFFGIGSSFNAALEGYNKFIRITPNVNINWETHMQYVAASLLSEKDVAVIISYSGSTKEIVDIARTAKSHGVKIICITRYLKSPLTNYSDVTLLCSTNERVVHGYSLSMELTQIFLLDILYTEYFRKTDKKSKKNKEISSSILLDKLY